MWYFADKFQKLVLKEYVLALVIAFVARVLL